MAVTIYDWRKDCPPISSLFSAGGMAEAGGVTQAGARVSFPSPGGRGQLTLAFDRFATDEANLAASWLMTRLQNGAVMRVPIWNSIQLVPYADLSAVANGEPWSNSEPWANNKNWLADPWAPVSTVGLKGAISFGVDMTGLVDVLKIGHLIGFFTGGYETTHIVMDISYDEDDYEATVTIDPPLRRDLALDEEMKFRPSMLVTCINPVEVKGLFQTGRHVQLANAQLVEFLI